MGNRRVTRKGNTDEAEAANSCGPLRGLPPHMHAQAGSGQRGLEE